MRHRRLRPWVKNIIFLLVAVLLISALVPTTTAYAKDAIGSKLTLEKIDGKAYVLNSKGKKIQAKEGVKLSAGEGVQTEVGSYVYISLDDSKVVKLDELSEVTVNKAGKKLCVEVEEGSLFFEVTEKLEDDESMQFKAGSVAMSIRGTSGVISLRRKGVNVVSGIELLDGRVDMVYGDVKGENHAFTMWGGESIVHADGSSALERELIDITEIEGFAAVEIQNRPELAQKVLKESGLNSNYAIEHAAELLKKDQEYNKANYSDVFEEGSEHSVRSILKKEKLEIKPLAAAPTNSRNTTKLAPIAENTPKPVVAAVVNNTKRESPSPKATEMTQVPVKASASPSPVLTPDPNIDWDAILRLLYPSPSKNPAPQPVVYYDNPSDENGGDSNGGEEYWEEEEPYSPPQEVPTPIPSKTPKPSPSPEPQSGGQSDPQPEPQPVTKYTVTFYGYDEVVLDIQEVTAGSDATPPEAPDLTGEGLVFTGWRNSYENVQEDMRVFANYVSSDTYFLVSFYDNFDPENPKLLKDEGVMAGQSVEPPTAPTHSGVVFEKWSNEDYKNVTSDVDVYTVYKTQSGEEKYKVTVLINGGENQPTEEVEAGGHISESMQAFLGGYFRDRGYSGGFRYSVEDSGYDIIAGRYIIGEDGLDSMLDTINSYSITQDTVFRVQGMYKVVLEYPNETLEVKAYRNYGVSIAEGYKEPPATYDGKTFSGWDDNGSGQDFNSITDNCTFTAKYEASSAKQYRLRVIWCNASMDSPTINYLDAATGYDSTATVLKEIMVDEGYNATTYDYQSVLSEFGKGGGVAKSQSAVQDFSNGNKASSMTGNVDIICWQ